MIEKHLFQKLIDKCFNKKHITLLFDNGEFQGFPDAYVRDGKNVFLIEIKDAFFPSSSVNSLSYNTIKDTIDQKYNNEKKGTGQIVKQLEHLIEATFEQKTFDQLRLKKRNLRIYPIMIYTDNFFNIPGMNQYLKSEFSNKLKAKNLNREFEKIEHLTFIHLSFLVDNIHFLSNPKFTLKKLIDEYHQRIGRMEKKFEKVKSMESMFSVNDSFESYLQNVYAEKASLKSPSRLELLRPRRPSQK